MLNQKKIQELIHALFLIIKASQSQEEITTIFHKSTEAIKNELCALQKSDSDENTLSFLIETTLLMLSALEKDSQEKNESLKMEIKYLFQNLTLLFKTLECDLCLVPRFKKDAIQIQGLLESTTPLRVCSLGQAIIEILKSQCGIHLYDETGLINFNPKTIVTTFLIADTSFFDIDSPISLMEEPQSPSKSDVISLTESTSSKSEISILSQSPYAEPQSLEVSPRSQAFNSLMNQGFFPYYLPTSPDILVVNTQGKIILAPIQ